MRGTDEQTGALFSYLSPEALIPGDNPTRAIRRLVNANATGRAEREAAKAMIKAAARGRRATLGADKAYGAAEHIAVLRAQSARTQVAPRRRHAVLCTTLVNLAAC